MAQVKKANVAPTHPTVYVGLALAAVGLLVATYAYTGTRVYDVRFAAVALLGGLLALGGILTAAWGRAIMSARASRARRAAGTGAPAAGAAAKAAKAKAEEPAPPTVAAPPEKKRFSFPLPKRAKAEPAKPAPEALFAFRRRDSAPADAAPAPTGAAATVVEAPPAPASVERVTLRCPQCATQFSVEGVRPMEARCPACGFADTV